MSKSLALKWRFTHAKWPLGDSDEKTEERAVERKSKHQLWSQHELIYPRFPNAVEIYIMDYS